MVFKSKFERIEIPPITLPDLIFGTWDEVIGERQAFIDAFSHHSLSFSQFKDLTYKVLQLSS